MFVETLRPTRLWQRLRAPGELPALARGVGIAFAIRLSGFMLSYLMTVILARLLGAAGLGTFWYTFNWMQLLGAIGTLGFGMSVVRFVPQYLSDGDWGRVRGVIRVANLATVAATALLTALLIGAFHVFPDNGIDPAVFVIGMAITPLFALEELSISILRSFKHIALAFAPTSVLRPILIIGFTLLLVLMIGRQDALLAVVALVTAVFIVWFLQHILVRQCIPQQVTSVPVVYEARHWLTVSLPLLLINSSSLILRRVTILLIGVFGSIEVLAIYAAAERIATSTQFLLISSNSVFAPMIAPLYYEKNYQKLGEYSRKIARWTFITSLLMSLALIIFADFLLGLFGEEFAAGRNTLIFLVVGQLVNAATGPVGILMNLTGHERASSLISAVAGIATLILSVLLIPVYGIEGAAFAVMVGLTVQNLWLYWQVRRQLGIDTFLVRLPWHDRPSEMGSGDDGSTQEGL